LTAFAAAVWGWIKLFVETTIKERVELEFDQKLELHKADLDREKQKAIKTFGLFSEKKYEINTKIYTTLRTAYQSVNTITRGMRSPIDTTLFSNLELDQFLTSAGIDLQFRKSLIHLHVIDPDIASIEINRRLPMFEREKVSHELETASDLTYTNEIFLARPVVALCDETIELLRSALSTVIAQEPRNRSGEVLAQVPAALARMVSQMRADLLGVPVEEDEPVVVRKSSPLSPMMHGMPETVPISILTDSQDLAKQLDSVHLSPEKFRRSRENQARAAEGRLAAATEALSENPRARGPRLEKIHYLLVRGTLEPAEKEVRSLLEDEPANLDAVLMLSDCLLRTCRPVEALKEINDYLAQRDDNAAAYVMRGTAYSFFNRKAAEEDLRRAISLDPDNGHAHAVLGDILWREKRVAEAVAEIVRALTLQPENSVAQLARLEIFAEWHLWLRIADLLDEVLLVHAGNPKVICLVGRALNLVKRFSDAVIFANRFVENGTQRRLPAAAQSAAFGIRSAARFGLEEYEGAILDADRAIGMTFPESFRFGGLHDAAHLAKVQSLEALQRWDETVLAAKAAYRSVRTGTYESARVIEILKRAFNNSQSAKASDPIDGSAGSRPE
jgi:tetratricopeptide (TPR) repeat protein